MGRPKKCPTCRSRADTCLTYILWYCSRCDAYWYPTSKVNKPSLGSMSDRRSGAWGQRAGRRGLRKDHRGICGDPWDERGWGHVCSLKWERKHGHKKIRQRWRVRLLDERKAA